MSKKKKKKITLHYYTLGVIQQKISENNTNAVCTRLPQIYLRKTKKLSLDVRIIYKYVDTHHFHDEQIAATGTCIFVILCKSLALGNTYTNRN